MMLIDLHAHSSGISKCCRIPARQVLEEAKKVGLDGIVLTNHYNKRYITDGDTAGLIRRYMNEIRETEKLGAEMGMKVFWGIEMDSPEGFRYHIGIYGVGEDFLEKYPELFDATPEEVWNAAKSDGGAVIHAHPYRNGGTPLDPRWLDGVEISCHPKYDSTHKDEVCAFAREHGLIVTCGGDYHADTHRPVCGMYLPDSITDSRALGKYLLETVQTEMLVHEIGAPAPEKLIYRKPD